MNFTTSDFISIYLFNRLLNKLLSNYILRYLSNKLRALFNSLFIKFYYDYLLLFILFCYDCNEKDLIFAIESLIIRLYITAEPSRSNIIGVFIMTYLFRSGCLLDSELFSFSYTVNTLLANIFVSYLSFIICLIIVVYFIHYSGNLKIKMPNVYKFILISIVISLSILLCNILLISFQLYYYIFNKLLNMITNYILRIGTPQGGQSGGPSSENQASGSNPQGPSGPEGGNSGFGSSSEDDRRRSRSRSSSPCSRGDCYFPGGEEDEKGFIKKCHRSFMQKTQARIRESNRPLAERESSYRTNNNIVKNTGLNYLDYSDHDLKSGLKYLNDQHHHGYIVEKPSNNISSINGFPLRGQALAEKAGSILYLKDGNYNSLTNWALAGAVRNTWTENSRD